MSSLITDPNAESPDVIDQRPSTDPTHFDPKPGDPSVTPGITLPTTIPEGWTIAADGSMVPLDDEPEPKITTIPELTITGSVPSDGLTTGAIVSLAIALTAFFGFLWARGGR